MKIHPFLALLACLSLLAGLQMIPAQAAIPDQTPLPNPSIQPVPAVSAARQGSSVSGALAPQGGGSWFGSNLIINGDAELESPGRPTSGWTGGLQDFIIAVTYTASSPGPGIVTRTDPGPSERGLQYFATSSTSFEVNAWQSKDISSISQQVDTGAAGFTLSGYFGQLQGRDDRAILRLYFQYANGTEVTPSVSIGRVTSADLLGKAGLLYRSWSGLLPKGTRKLTFQLQMITPVQSGNADAVADNLSLILSRPRQFLPLISTSGMPSKLLPAAPSNLLVVVDTLKSLRLTWTESSTNVTSFKIERAPGGSTSYAVLAYVMANQTSYLDNYQLSANTQYTYRVTAGGPTGDSPPATANGQTPPKPTIAPNKPAPCWMSNIGSTSAQLFWTDSSKNEEYFSLYINQAQAGYGYRLLANTAPSATTVTIVDLLPGVQTTFSIFAINDVGTSPACTVTFTPPSSQSGIKVINKTSYPIAYLAINGVQEFPVGPMGIPPGDYYELSLPSGKHAIEIRTGFWQDQSHRFDLYTYITTTDLQAGNVNLLTVNDMTIEDILTQFDQLNTGYGYWEGYYFDSGANCHTAAFRFYPNSTYKFYVGNVQQSIGNYNLVNREPGIYSLKFNAGGKEGLLLETNGRFYMKNGPPSWLQIEYSYKFNGYQYNPFCP